MEKFIEKAQKFLEALSNVDKVDIEKDYKKLKAPEIRTPEEFLSIVDYCVDKKFAKKIERGEKTDLRITSRGIDFVLKERRIRSEYFRSWIMIAATIAMVAAAFATAYFNHQLAQSNNLLVTASNQQVEINKILLNISQKQTEISAAQKDISEQNLELIKPRLKCWWNVTPIQNVSQINITVANYGELPGEILAVYARQPVNYVVTCNDPESTCNVSPLLVNFTLGNTPANVIKGGDINSIVFNSSLDTSQRPINMVRISTNIGQIFCDKFNNSVTTALSNP